MSLSTPQNRGGAGRWPKGTSGNPGGRPKGLARYVRELVGDDGRRIADFMLGVLEDETERTETRMQAATWLADRGLGEPMQPQEVELSAHAGFDPDEVKKGAEWFTAEIRRLSEIRRRFAAASETA
jgi:Family of unknown function (DUF5681)